MAAANRNDQGETFVLRAGPACERIHTNSIGESTLASPALVDGRWYIRTDRSLFSIGRSEGSRVIIEIVSAPEQLEREWMAQWRRASGALARVRAEELSHLAEADALAATDALLAIGATMPLSVERRTWSGLIAFQRYIHGRR
jgi:hypothetical protein